MSIRFINNETVVILEKGIGVGLTNVIWESSGENIPNYSGMFFEENTVLDASGKEISVEEDKRSVVGIVFKDVATVDLVIDKLLKVRERLSL